MKKEFQIISELIENNTKVLDVGCGDGTLMKFLKDEKIEKTVLLIPNNEIKYEIEKAVLESNIKLKQKFIYVKFFFHIQSLIEYIFNIK